MKNNNVITNAELHKIFVNDNKKTIQDYASRIRKQINNSDPGTTKKPDSNTPSKDVSIQLIEPIIYDKITKNPTNQDLKLAVEILKIKIANKGMDDKLDIDKYILKGKNCQDVVDEIPVVREGNALCGRSKQSINTGSISIIIDKNEQELNIPDGYISRGKLIYDTLTHKELAKEFEDDGYDE